MEYDGDQRTAIEAAGNVVVSAGAGSGKTTVLAERYLNLVKNRGVPVRNILTLTFTRKAAFEMRERIYKRLRAESENPTVRDQLSAFDDAQISTLDSFCAQIVREAGSAYGLPPDFLLDEEENRAAAEEVALRFLLDHAEDPLLVRLIAVNGFDSTWRGFLAAIVGEVISLAYSSDFPRLADRQMAFLRRQLVELCRETERRAEAFLSFDPAGAKAIQSRQERVASFDFEPLKAHADAVFAGGDTETLEEMSQALGDLIALDKRVGGNKREDIEEIKEAIESLKEVAAETESVVRSLLMEEDFRHLFGLLADFEERVLATKRSRAVFSYRDIVELSIRILSEQDDLRRYYASRFRHIMIDEFQDNNADQKKLLYLLCTPERDAAPEQKLFFVGDDKQSIYRFRGADVGVFRGLATELATQGGRHIRLDNNYRSDPRLIELFNQLFDTVMAESSEAYEASFLPLTAMLREHSSEPIMRICVKHENAEEPEGELLSVHEAEAYHIAKSVRSLVEEQRPPVPDGNGNRALRYSDIALLMRSTSNQNLYERMFRLFDVPYSTQSVRSLFQEAPVYDIYNVLQLAIYPDDRAAYAALLRSPFCNLSDEGLARVLLAERAPFADVKLAEEDARRYAAAAAMYDDICSRVDREEPERLIRRLWDDYGYRYWLMRKRGNQPYLEYIDYFFELSRLNRSGSLAELLDLIRENLGEYRRMAELDVLQRSNDGVQILTVHKSKGLEFPVVILANAGNLGRREGTGSKPYYVSAQHGLTINLPAEGSHERQNYFFRAGRAEEKAREQAEVKRLLYVALTRAQNHVIVAGALTSTNKNSTEHHLGMVLEAAGYDIETRRAAPERLSRHLEIEQIGDVPRTVLFAATSGTGNDPVALASSYAAQTPITRSFPQREFTATALNAAFIGSRREVSAEELPSLAIDELIGEGTLEGEFGTLCHWLIEQELAGTVDIFAAVSRNDIPPRLFEERSDSERDRITGDATALLRSFFASPAGRRIKEASESGRVESELPILLSRDVAGEQILVRGSVDLLVIGEGEIELYDFKSDRHRRPDDYSVQLALYAEAVSELYGRAVSPALIYLRAPTGGGGEIAYPCSQELLAECVRSCREAERGAG